LLTQLSFVESSSGILITQQVFADSVFFAESSHFADLSIFCWYSISLLSHHQVFVLTNQMLLTQHIVLNQLMRQQIVAYSAIFCWVIIRHFDNSARFWWHIVFLLNQLLLLGQTLYLTLILMWRWQVTWQLTRTITLGHVTTDPNPNPNPKQWAWSRAWFER